MDSRCLTAAVLYAEVYAQCDKLATITGRTELTTLATVDVWYRNFPGTDFGREKLQAEVSLIFGILEFL